LGLALLPAPPPLVKNHHTIQRDVANGEIIASSAGRVVARLAWLPGGGGAATTPPDDDEFETQANQQQAFASDAALARPLTGRPARSCGADCEDKLATNV
jgi:hypothetical protein